MYGLDDRATVAIKRSTGFSTEITGLCVSAFRVPGSTCQPLHNAVKCSIHVYGT